MSDCNAEVNQSVSALLRRGPVPAPSASRKSAGRAEGGDSRPLTKRSNSSPNPNSSASSQGQSDHPSPLNEAARHINRQVVRAAAYHMRTDMRDMIRDVHKPLSLCGLGCKPGQGGQPGEVSVTVDSGNFPKARLTGTTRCSSPWSCPVCAPALADQRAMALEPQVAGAVALGFTVWLGTFTVHHHAKSDLANLFRMIVKAWGRVTSGKWWQNLRDVGEIEFVRGCDVTWSEVHGWHPHLHATLLISPKHGDPEAIAKRIKEMWMKACASIGLSTSGDAQDVQRVDDPAAAARYAVATAAVYEAHAMAKKRSRGKGHGLTPMEIAELAIQERLEREGRADARGVHVAEEQWGPWERLWRDYVGSTKGLRQCTTSRGLDLDPDRENAEKGGEDQPQDMLKDAPGALKLATLGTETMRRLDRRKAAPGLLQIAEFGIDHMTKLREIERYLSGILPALDSRCDWKIAWPPKTKEATAQGSTVAERIRRRDEEVPM